MAQYCNQFEFDESSDEFIMGAEPPEAFSMYPSSNPGPPGPPGPGVPAGGTAGQLLAKASGADYDTEWSDPPELDAEHVTYDDTETYSDGTVGKKLSDLNSAINSIEINKADVIVSSASGAVASFSDGMEAPIKSLEVEIEPIQDLHGYPSPWPAGGGKNLLPMTLANMKTINTAGTWSGNAYTLYGVTYTVNVDDGGNVVSISATGTATQYGLFRLVNEWTNTSATTISGTASGSSGSGYRLQVESNGTVITQDTGKQGSIPANTSVTRVIIVVPSGVNPSGAVFKPMIRLSTVSDTTFAPYENLCPISGHTGVTVHVADGENPHVVDNEYHITFPDAAGTVYDGTLQVNEDGSGTLTSNFQMVTFSGSDSQTWGVTSGTNYYQFSYALNTNIYAPAASVTAICDSFQKIELADRGTKSGLVSYSGDKTLRFALTSDFGITTATQWKTWCASNPVHVLAPLLNPVTYTLTPEQVGAVITTLYGDNNVWADTGDVSLDYRADTKLYIDGKLAELVAQIVNS